MLSIPPEMAKVNQFIIANIPSAKDLYEKMGFRYQTGLGHNSVENALGATFANQPKNASIEGLYDILQLCCDLFPYVWQFHGNYSLLLKNFVFGRSFDNVFLKKQHNYPHQMRFFLQCSSASIDVSLCGILIVAGIS